MTKRGNNYSGPRWVFAQPSEPKRNQPKPTDDGGLTIMGGSNRKRVMWRDSDTKRPDTAASDEERQ